MKQLLIFLISPLLAFTQIQIDDVGDGWKTKVEQALHVIKTTDIEKYNLVIKYCDHISYTLTPYSTSEDGHVILLATSELHKGIVNDIAAAIVHESLHLYLINVDMNFCPYDEEALCYAYELEFLCQIPGVEPFLIEHAYKQYQYYHGE